MIRISGASRCATLLALIGLPVGLSVFGCSTADTVSASAVAPNAGSIGLALQTSGVTLNSVSYTILGSGFSKSGSINVATSTQISAVIGDIPTGDGYSITLNASDASNPLTICTGSASFNIAAGVTTSALVHLQCRTPAKTGSVLVNGTVNVCPVLGALSVTPAETMVSNSVSLSASASDVDHSPGALSYLWTASGGMLSGATTASATLVCTDAGLVTVTLSVSDGDCSDTLSQTVVCSAVSGGSAGAGGAPNAGSGGTMSGGTGGAAGSFSGASGATAGNAGSAGAGGGAGLIRINEIESNGGIPDDWVELYNPGTQPIDISGYVFRDNDDTHVYFIPAGTVVLPGAYYVMDTGVTGFNFGLGSTDATRLYLPDGTTIVDSFNWTAHATTTYGRCPNGSGAFSTTASSTKGGANDCGSAGGASGGSAGASAGGAGGTAGGFGGSAGTGGAAAGSAGSTGTAGAGGALSTFNVWPGGDSVVTVDVANTFPSNLSGLLFEPGQGGNPDVLWGVQNGPSKLYRLLWDGTVWTQDTANGWSDGKTLSYTTGLGAPDSEGVTKTEFGTNPLYVSTERDNNNNAVSRLSVLMFDDTSALSTISAVKDWNLTLDLPVAGPNLGLEAITWVPDAYLVSKGFIDESKNLPYDPASYPDHAGGIFFVGLEQNGMIYGYALDHVGGGFTRVATVVSGNPSIMDLNFDREVGYLWAACDNTCAGRTNVLDIDTRVGSPTLGKFYIRQGFERPSMMPDTNNEGFTVTPESTCAGGFKSVFYADDNDLNGHAIRRGSIPCGAFL